MRFCTVSSLRLATIAVSLAMLLMISVSAGRLSNKERKRTITEELLADPELSQARKRRFDKLQVFSHA